MHLIRFFQVLVFSILVCSVLTEPIKCPTPQLGNPRRDLHPRIYEEILNGRWHMYMEMVQQFIPPKFAFWGLRYFLHSLTSRIAGDFLTRPPLPYYSFTVGSLVLDAESVTDQPIAWETIEWLLGRLNTWVENDWPGGEIKVWLTDELLDNTVYVSLRVLLDSPLD